MKIRNPKRAMPLHQVPTGSVFGTLEGGCYTRFLRLAVEASDGISVVSLGPSIDSELPGPTAFFLDSDTVAYLEEDTLISPKLTDASGNTVEPSRPSRIPVGAMIVGSDGETYLYCRARRGERALVNLATGKFRSSLPEMAIYESYVLVVEDELGKKRIAFDSATEAQARVAA